MRYGKLGRQINLQKYDDSRIMAESSMKRERREIELNLLKGWIKRYSLIRWIKISPLTEQILRFRIGIGEVLSFHSVVFEKAYVEKNLLTR